MKIVVIGGNGLIGTKLVQKLRQLGHDVVAGAGPNPVPLDNLAGRFLSANRDPRQVVIDVLARYFGL